MQNVRRDAIAILGLACAFFSAIIEMPAQATQPTPPAQVRIPDADTLESLRPSAGAFTVPAQVHAHQEVPPLTVTIRSIAIGPPGRRALEKGVYELPRLARGHSRRIDLRIEAEQEDGNHRIEVALEGEIDGRRGIVDKSVFYLVVEQGRARLMTPGDLRRMQVNRRNDAFEGALERQPGSADIKPLGNRTVPVSAGRTARIRPHTGPELRRAGASGPPAAIAPYIVDHTESARRQMPSLAATVQLVPSTFLSGQVVFEDFYYINSPPNVLTPLANATVWVVQRYYGKSFLLATVTTDDNGRWEAQFFPAATPNDPVYYYMILLDNSALTVRDAAGNDYTWVSADRSGSGVIDFGQEVLTIDAEAAQVFATANRGWNHIVAEGGQDPGPIDIQYPDFCLADSDDDPAVEVWVEVSCFDPVEQIVRIRSEANAGPDVILHEYGHALMHRAFGTSLPGGIHSIADVEQDPGLAYSEGWATAFALSVCPDGRYTTYEGVNEGVDEWPICAMNFDAGEEIELFSHDDSTDQPDTDLSDDNRIGVLHEGRIAAAITDLLDAPDDDNNTDEDRGQSGYEDANQNDPISLATIYRDHMVGFFHADYADFLAALQGDLSGTTRSLASAINVYNYITIPVPVICVASKVAMALSPAYAATLDGLRAFRDQVLMPLQIGRGWIQSYYSNSPEMAVLLIGSPQARESAQVIIEYFARFGRTLSEPGGRERLSRSRAPALPARVVKAIAEVSRTFEAEGSPELRQKVAEAKRFLRTFRGMTVGAAVRRVAAMKPADQNAKRIQPRDFAPGSQEVDWLLIRQHLPEEERMAWTTP